MRDHESGKDWKRIQNLVQNEHQTTVADAVGRRALGGIDSVKSLVGSEVGRRDAVLGNCMDRYLFLAGFHADVVCEVVQLVVVLSEETSKGSIVHFASNGLGDIWELPGLPHHWLDVFDLARFDTISIVAEDLRRLDPIVG